METVTLKTLLHNEKECIGIYSRQNATLHHYFQKKAGAKWSKSNKCWYIPCTEQNYELLAKVLKGIAVLEFAEPKRYLIARKKKGYSAPIPKQNAFIENVGLKKSIPTHAKPVQKLYSVVKLSKENNDALQKFVRHLVLKSYSPSTIKTYTKKFIQFLQAIKEVPAIEFTAQRIKDYLQYCFEKLKLSENTLHSRMNALKFYYESVLKREKFFWEIPRPKKQNQLPKVLDESEIWRMFN